MTFDKLKAKRQVPVEYSQVGLLGSFCRAPEADSEVGLCFGRVWRWPVKSRQQR